MTQKIFTLTAGRSGSGWLAKFVEANLGINAIHEPLGIDDFDSKMPSVTTMRSFNTRGMDAVVREFWRRKLKSLPTDEAYCETNHTLGKCGLIETIAEQPNADDYTVIILKRNLAKQCASYIQRHDFCNISMMWQWYLAHNYPNNMVSSKPLLPLGANGVAIWYTLEMDSRQHYYERSYGDRVRFINVQLEEVVKPDGAARLLADLGYDQEPVLPPKYNANVKNDAQLVDNIAGLLANSGYDPEQIVSNYLEANQSLAMQEAKLAS